MGMVNKRVLWSGLAAGVLCHILQGTAAYLVFDRFYLENPDIVRDSSYLVGLYYLFLNLILGVVLAHLIFALKTTWDMPDWKVGMKTGFLVWAVSSPIWIIKRQILLKLSNWLLLEIISDLVVYIVIGIVAGYLIGQEIIQRVEE